MVKEWLVVKNDKKRIRKSIKKMKKLSTKYRWIHRKYKSVNADGIELNLSILTLPWLTGGLLENLHR